MRAIWKFPLRISDEQEVVMPAGAQPLSVGIQEVARSDLEEYGGVTGPQLVVWLLVHPKVRPMKRHRFYIHGTGHQVRPEIEAQNHIGTVQWPGDLIWHVFDGGEHE